MREQRTAPKSVAAAAEEVQPWLSALVRALFEVQAALQLALASRAALRALQRWLEWLSLEQQQEQVREQQPEWPRQ